MNRAIKYLKNEDGSLIMFIMMILALVLLAGVSGIRTANTEVEIASSELRYQMNFYLAEGAAMEAVELLEGISNPLENKPDWVYINTGGVTEQDIEDFWENAGPIATAIDEQTAAIDPVNARFFAVYEGVSGGAGQDGESVTKRDFTIYGRSERDGVCEVRIGYRKIF